MSHHNYLSSSNSSRSASRRTTPSKKHHANTGDRFIPNHVDLDRPVISENYRACKLNFESPPEQKGAIERAFRKSMFGHAPSKVLSFGSQRQQASNNSMLTPIMSPTKNPRKSKRTLQMRPTDPSKRLDAPGLRDDFYLNPLAWSSGNVIAVALDQDVYTGDMSSGGMESNNVYSAPGETYVSSVEWLDNSHLIVGISSGRIKIVDVEAKQEIRCLKGHVDRVSALSWSPMNGLSSGCRDGHLFHSDLRQRQHVVASLPRAHDKEICQVRWSPNERHLATGGNDNKVKIWDGTSKTKPSAVFSEHTAAVKAIAWHPCDSSMIATGGGMSDRTIKLWNARTGYVRKSVYTGSQVTCMLWNPHVTELLTGHGFDNKGCELSLWKGPSLTQTQTFTLRQQQHEVRPFAMALGPDSSKVCIASSDDTLCIWDMFQPLLHNKKTEDLGLSESYAKSFGDDLPMSNAFWGSMQIR